MKARRALGVGVLLALFAVAPAASDEKKGAAATLKDLAWLAGAWEGDSPSGKFEEHWTTPVGGLMLGMGRETQGDKVLFFEFLQLVQTDDGGIDYRVLIAGMGPEAIFKLVRHDQTEDVFERVKDDFPKRIVYARQGDGALVVRIEGPMGGKGHREEFKLRRRKP